MSCLTLDVQLNCGFWSEAVRPFRAEGERSASLPQSFALLHPSSVILLVTPELFLLAKGSAKAQGGCGPSLVLPSRSYFALGRGAPLFGCAPSLWLSVCCCRARALLGCSGGAGVPPLCGCLVRGLSWVLGERRSPAACLWLKVSSLFSHAQAESSVSFGWLSEKQQALLPTVGFATTPPTYQACKKLGVSSK